MPKKDCNSCHGSGFVSGDWVDYGSTKTQLPDDFCDCILEQLPDDYDEKVEVNIVPIEIDPKLEKWIIEYEDLIKRISAASGFPISELEYKIKMGMKEISCPDCAGYGDDDQYCCTTCWCQGGNGVLTVGNE